MRTRRILILSFSLIQLYVNNSTLFAFLKDGQREPTRYEILYDQLMNLAVDPEKVAPVHNLIIQRDAGTFQLNTGYIYLCKPIGNKIRACVFIGDGTFSFNPPNDIERGQIKRFFEKDNLSLNIQSLFLFFADTTLQEFTPSLKFDSVVVPSEVSSVIKKALKYEGKTDDKDADYFLMKTLLEGFDSGLFYSFINTESDNQLAFVINPYEDEEVLLLRKDAYYFSNSMEIISQFPLKKKTSEIVRQKKSFIGERYIIDCTFSDDLGFSAQAKVILRSQQSNHRWLSFSLYSKLAVDSVLYADGTPLQFFKGKGNPLLWIQWPVLLARGKSDTVRIFYHGDLAEKINGVVFIKSASGWFPCCTSQLESMKEKAFYDLTFRYPTDFILVAVGKRVMHTVADDHTISRWITEKPVWHISFYLGKFEEYRFVEDTIPPVTVLLSSIGEDYKVKYVGTSITSSIRFYQDIFGKCPVDSIYIVDVPYSHGISFPGFIHLSTLTFQQNSTFERTHDIKLDIVFRAHEAAHQWWGNGVGVESYRDAWLSEGFAEYAALLYAQAVLKDNDKFFEILKQHKDRILNARKYLLQDGQPTGPIYLGFRNETSSTEGDYSRIVYDKAAWVLHMLRNMMIDLNTMNEDNFYNMMKEFYTTYRGGKASTADFQRMVEKYTGEDMSWFFNQWVYGTEIPVYSFDYEVDKIEDGKFKVHCMVKTEGVSDNFKMPVPLLIRFDDRRYVRLRVMIQGKSSEFDLPFLPLEPDKILFNDLESVLCDID